MATQDRAVVGDRGRLSLEDVLDVADVALARLRDRQLLGARGRGLDLLHQLAQPRLGLLAWSSPGGCPAGGRAELALDAAIANPPLPVPDAATDAEVAGAV